MPEVILDKADRILIAVVDQAVKRGVGRTFRTKAGTEVRVEAITDKSVRLAHGPMFGEHLVLPRDVRRIARLTAALQGRVRL